MSPAPPDPAAVRRAVTAALQEDLGPAGDVTTRATVPADRRARATFVAREPLVLAGVPVAVEVLRQVDPGIVARALAAEGSTVARSTVVLEATGLARSLLEAERTALNFLQRLSGIATATRGAVEEIAGTGAVILDTRKTAPGLRVLDKYAVAVGGGVNHRMGLYDAVMIKDTHLGAGGSLGDAIRRCLADGHPPARITAEVRTPAELDEAIASGAGRALLDNMSSDALEECVRRGKGRIVLEASGGLRPGGLHAVAAAGVDALSLGYLTHSTRAADLAMDLEALP